MRIGDTFKKAASLFVEMPEGTQEPQKLDALDVMASTPIPKAVPRTVEDVVREQPGPNLDEIKVAADPAQPVVDSTGAVHFVEIYRLAALPTAPLTAEQILEILSSLPADLPLASKRATVKVTIDAMSKTANVTTDSIVTDASRKLAALNAYTKSFSDQAADYVQKAEADIAGLESQIAARKASIEDAKKRQQVVTEACTAESERLDEVLEFFTLDAGASKHAPQDGAPPA
jgi:hypothetical protein